MIARHDIKNVEGIKVALLGPYPLEAGKFRNGVESVTSALADGLADRGIDVYAITGDPDIRKPIRFQTSSGVKAHRLPFSRKLGNLTGYAADIRLIRAELDEIKPDIVHVHKILAYARAALGYKYRTVLTLHGIHYREAALQRGLAGIRARFACRYEREALRKAEHIICINKYAAQSCRNWIKTQNLRFIDNPIDDRYFDVPTGGELPGRILYAGQITERKNILGLLRAIEILTKDHPDIRLRIAGKIGEQDYYQTCLQYIAEQALQDKVAFLGSLGVDSMIVELLQAAMLVLPSKQETAPVIVSEAMAASKSVVATNAGGTAEMVEDGVTGFVTPVDDTPALASAMDKLLIDADLRRQMGEAGRRSAQLRFRRSVVIDKTIALYGDMIGDK